MLDSEYIKEKIITYFGTFDHFYDIIENDEMNYAYRYFRDGDQFYLVNDFGEILTWYKHIGRCTYFSSAIGDIDTFLDNLEEENND